jgi:hypothetical protein
VGISIEPEATRDYGDQRLSIHLRALGKDDGVNFSITLGEKDFLPVVGRHVDNRINRETRSS